MGCVLCSVNRIEGEKILQDFRSVKNDTTFILNNDDNDNNKNPLNFLNTC